MTDGVTEEPDDKTTAIAVAAHVPGAFLESRADARVMLLDSDEQGRELAIALQHLGAMVIVVAESQGAPAHRVADQSLVMPMTDTGEMSKVLQGLRPDFLVTATNAPDALAGLDAERTQLVPSARAVRLIADCEGLRRLAADELGLPTAPFWFVGSVGELEAVGAHAGFPLLLTPVAEAAGQERSVVLGPDDIGPAWHRAGAQRALAETVVEVELYVTLLVVCSDGPNGLLLQFCSPIGHRGPGAVSESWQPQQLSPAAMDAARSIAARIVKALGGRGVFGVELMINGDEVYFADITARPRESAWVTLRSQRLSVFELQARAILGLPVDTMMISPGAARAVDPGGAPAAAALTAALGVPESDARLFGPGPRAGSWIALATAADVAAARERAREVAGRAHMPDSGQ